VVSHAGSAAWLDIDKNRMLMESNRISQIGTCAALRSILKLAYGPGIRRCIPPSPP
jgi:hypothetical protein